MNTPEPRYAIYFVPGPETELYRFGASVLGYDAYSGRATPLIDGAEASQWRGLVREPSIYGFHATLKPPFQLAKGLGEADVETALLDFAANHPAVLVGKLAVREIGSFIALVPNTARPLLDRLAQNTVRDFDRFRLTMSAQERARRMVPGLSDRQIENLDRWGYPYVFEDFRFHMTLTGPLPGVEKGKALSFLCEKFEQMLSAVSLTVDQIVLARQPNRSSSFQVTRVALLGQSPSRPYAYSF